MKSYQLVETNQPLEMVETENPEPQGSEVLVRITASGVCHSDLYFWQGGYDMGGGKKVTLEERGIYDLVAGKDRRQITYSSVCLVANSRV